MNFAHDTEVALAATVTLINTLGADGDRLSDQAGLDAFLTQHPYSGAILHTTVELDSLRALRPRLRQFWTVDDRDEAAGLVNTILADADARPYLSKHDELDWHLHVTDGHAPLVQRIAAESAMAFLDLIRADELDRLRICAAEDCEDVLVDLSRNRSRRYCDGTCGNRANVLAYRARRRAR